MKHSLHRTTKLALLGRTPRINAYLAVLRWSQQRKYKKIASLISYRMQNTFGVFISPRARISKSVRFPHPAGIVIGDGVIIDESAIIYQNVTLGGARIGDADAGKYPRIGSGTVVFAGAVIAGGIRIGRGCTIGANAVVLSDVPDGATAVGVPARILSKKPRI